MKLSRFYIDSDIFYYFILNSTLVPSNSFLTSYKWFVIDSFGTGIIVSNAFNRQVMGLLEYLKINRSVPSLHFFKAYYFSTKHRLKNFSFGITDFLAQKRIFLGYNFLCHESNIYHLQAELRNDFSSWIINYWTYGRTGRASRKEALTSFFFGRNFFMNNGTSFLSKLFLLPFYNKKNFDDIVSIYNSIWSVIGFWGYMHYDWILHVFLFTQIRDKRRQRCVVCMKAYYFYHVVRTWLARDYMTFFFTIHFYDLYLVNTEYFNNYCTLNNVSVINYYLGYWVSLYSRLYYTYTNLYRMKKRFSFAYHYNRSFGIVENVSYDNYDFYVLREPMLDYTLKISRLGSYKVNKVYTNYGVSWERGNLYYNPLRFKREDKLLFYFLSLYKRIIKYFKKLFKTCLNYIKTDLFFKSINNILNAYSLEYFVDDRHNAFVWKNYLNLFEGVCTSYSSWLGNVVNADLIEWWDGPSYPEEYWHWWVLGVHRPLKAWHYPPDKPPLMRADKDYLRRFYYYHLFNFTCSLWNDSDFQEYVIRKKMQYFILDYTEFAIDGHQIFLMFLSNVQNTYNILDESIDSMGILVVMFFDSLLKFNTIKYLAHLKKRGRKKKFLDIKQFFIPVISEEEVLYRIKLVIFIMKLIRFMDLLNFFIWN